MSGTGNTYRMACRMKEIANPYMEDIKIVMIDEADAENEPTPYKDTLLRCWGGSGHTNYLKLLKNKCKNTLI